MGVSETLIQLISSMEKKMEKVTKSREDKQGCAPVVGTGREHGVHRESAYGHLQILFPS